MNRSFRWRGMTASLAVLAAMGCKDLDITNPNAPDAARALSDPATIAAAVGGTLRTWMQVRQHFDTSLLWGTMADVYTASWNNFNIRYYSSYANECPQRCGWVNATTSSFYPQIETAYYGYYSALSSANDGLTAIRKNGVIITSPQNTKMIETIGVMMQGMTLAGIALQYDQGFIVDENTDLSNPGALPVATRQELRDAAMAKLDEAYALATANSFTTPSTYTGAVNGYSYTNTQIAQVIRTMQAELLADFPRSGAEVAGTNWARVAQLAAQGINGFDFQFFVDPDFQFGDRAKLWGNSNFTVRIDTRLGKLIPGSNVTDPWPSPGGNPPPNSTDKRLGDGTWGPADNVSGTGTRKATANAGTDFAWNGVVIFPSARGQYHQSELHHSRYSWLAYEGEGLPGETSSGPAKIYDQAFNDLIWAEALLRSGGSKAQAATLINRTRVTRGGLTALTGAEATAAMLDAVKYEQLIETIGLGTHVFYVRRRFDDLWAQTPRHQPIPAKELQLLRRELYTFGGPGAPDMAPGVDGAAGRVKNVREIWADIEARYRGVERRVLKR
jgi:hypothetical protein